MIMVGSGILDMLVDCQISAHVFSAQNMRYAYFLTLEQPKQDKTVTGIFHSRTVLDCKALGIHIRDHGSWTSTT